MPKEIDARGNKLVVGTKISRENVKEYQNERRAKELSRRGYNEGQISAMMLIPESNVKKMVKHSVNQDEMQINGTL